MMIASISCVAISQMADTHFSSSYISVDDGLSQSTVTSILRDREGFLWFATADGLNRYDGAAFTVFKHDQHDEQSISSNVLAPLALTGQGTIWIGTSTGLAKYEKRTNAFSIVSLNSKNLLINDQSQITQLLCDKNKVLWVGTTTGLTTIPLEANSIFHGELNDTLKHALHGDRVFSIFEDRNGIIWIGAGKNLLAFNEKQSTVKNIPIPHPIATIESIYEDSFGILWFGTDDSRLLRYDPRNDTDSRWTVYLLRSDNLKTLLGNFITAITEDRAGHLWVGTRSLGLFQFDRTGHEWIRFIPPPVDQRFEGVTSLFVDRSGLLWVGYDGAGILKINPNPVKFHRIILPDTNPLTSGENFLKPVIADHLGRLWIGTYDQGLTMLDRKKNERMHFVHDQHTSSSLSDNSLLSLVEDHQGRVWIGTVTGVDCYNEKAKSFLHYSTLFSPTDSVEDGEVWCLAVDASDTLWACTSLGLLKFNEENKEFQTVISTNTQKSNWVTCMAFDTDSSLWLGTAKTGVLHINRTGTIVENFSTSKPNTVPINFIKSLMFQTDGVLWIGTVSGLCRYDTKRKSWIAYHLRDGLPDETIYGILPSDSHTMWFSTNKGLVRMNTNDLTHPLFRCYTPEDGLQSYEFNSNTYFRAATGEMFFGGINGLNSFFPDSVIDNPNIPPIVLTAFKKFDLPFDLGQATETAKSITLRYSESVFSFEFAALEFTSPHRNAYAYKMEGYDRDWVQCGNLHQARYTNLDPGEYAFRVRGSNNDGVWNEQGIAVAISIVPPFWRTLWFFTVVVVCLAGMFGGVVRYLSVRKIRQKLELLEREKSIELHRQATRERIARDLHDEVSSTLSSMSLFAESSKLRMQSDSQDAKGVLSRLHDMAREAEEAMEQAVWSLAPNHQQLSHLLSRIHDVAIEQCGEHQIHCVVHLPELQDDFVLSDVVRKNCYLIFRESLANIIRHSGAGNTELSLEVSEYSFRMIVKDDGNGFDTNTPNVKSRGGNGLKNISSRSAEMGASIEVHSQLGKGTTLILSMQIAQMRY